MDLEPESIHFNMLGAQHWRRICHSIRVVPTELLWGPERERYIYIYTIYGYMGPSGTCTQTTRLLDTGLVVDHPLAL